jgi:hypothetical protein
MLYYLGIFYLGFVLFFVCFTLGLRKGPEDRFTSEDNEIEHEPKVIDLARLTPLKKNA